MRRETVDAMQKPGKKVMNWSLVNQWSQWVHCYLWASTDHPHMALAADAKVNDTKLSKLQLQCTAQRIIQRHQHRQCLLP